MTRKITPTQLDEIEAAAKKASSVYGRGWHSEVSLERDTRGRIPAWHRDAKHIAMMDPATTLALVAEVRELRAKVERVRLLHEPSGDPEVDSLSTCDTCADLDGKSVRWPCDTIKALGEEA